MHMNRCHAPSVLVSRALVGVMFVASSGLLSCSKAPDPTRLPDIIVFTVDTLRADAVGALGASPSPTSLADAWAKDGVTFTRAFATRGQTHPSLASMLTGLYPATHGLQKNGDTLAQHHATLAQLLKKQGYQTAAFCSSLDLSRWNFWVRGFDVAYDGTNGRMVEDANRPDGQWQWDHRVAKAAIEFVRKADPEKPLFLWVHLFDAHGPYSPHPADAAKFADPTYAGPLKSGKSAGIEISAHLFRHNLGTSDLTAADLDYARAMYHASIAGADQKLSTIADVLRERERWNDAIRVYTADHGEDLGEHARYYGHGNSIYDTTLRIPLIVAWPGRTPPGVTNDSLVQNLDLFATLLRAAEIAPPVDSEAIDLAPLWRDEAPGRDVVIAELEGEMHSISDGRWKLVSNPTGLQPQDMPYQLTPDRGFPYKCRELYEVSTDVGEQIDVYRKDHPEAVRLLKRLDEFLADPRHRARAAATISADEAALNALGYVGSAAQKAPRIKCD